VATVLGQWSDAIQQAADEAGVPWQIVAALVIVESGGDPTWVSPTGAIGLTQIRPHLYPETVARIGGDVTEPQTNLRAAATVLAELYAGSGSWQHAIAAFTGRVNTEGEITDAIDDQGLTGSEFVAKVEGQSASLGYAIGPAASAYGAVVNPPAVIEIAMTTIGTPYIWGGESYEEGGFDCSGLMLWAFNQVGKSLPRTAAEQFAATERIAAADVRPGDMIFFANTYSLVDGRPVEQQLLREQGRVITHVGIYAGNGLMLHAPKEGDVVRFVSLYTPFWRTHLAGYGRVN
jgi:cell wall-associated NlpC family hydrolase